MKSANVVGAVFGTIINVAVIVTAVVLIYHGATVCYDFGYRIFTEPAVSSGEGRTVTVSITKDMKVKDIGELFVKKGLIRDANLFVLQYYLSEYREDVEPGTFELSTAMTADEMMEAMVPAAKTQTAAAE